jgi:predicted transcriptional regulator
VNPASRWRKVKMPNVKVTCNGCNCVYDRFLSESCHPKTNFCSRKCRTKFVRSRSKKAKSTLVESDKAVLNMIKKVDGISTNELRLALDMEYTNVIRATSKLWNLGLVGELYGTWTTNREEATEGEFKVMTPKISNN